MKTKEIPPIIHLICLPPFTVKNAEYNLSHLAVSHPEFEVKVHTSVPDNFVFKDLPVFGPAQLSTLVRMDVLRKYGGWYFDLDIHVNCHLKELEKILNIGNKLTISLDQNLSSVCTFASCCPDNWSGWDSVFDYLLKHPRSAPGHYCSSAMRNLLKEKPLLCDYLPSNFTHSNSWLSHKGIKH